MCCEDIGGAEGDRTPDLMTASHALSQLSYGPGRFVQTSLAFWFSQATALKTSPHANKLLQAAINEFKVGEHCGVRWTCGTSLLHNGETRPSLACALPQGTRAIFKAAGRIGAK